MAAHRGPLDEERTNSALPVQSCTCNVHAPDLLPARKPSPLPEHAKPCNSAACRFRLPAQDAEQPRTEQSRRAESSYKDWSDVPDVDRPLAQPRAAHAAALFSVLKEHDISILRFAGMLGVNERQARKYLEARAPIPTTIFDALPRTIGDDFARRIRCGSGRSVADRFKAALAELELEGATDDLILEGHARLGALAGRRGAR